MGVIDATENWLFGVALRKVVKRLVGLLIAFIASKQLGKYGVAIDADTLTVSLYGLIEIARNALKNKYGLKYL